MEQTFTVIGTYYDNNQGWGGDFVAADADDAKSQAQAEVKKTRATEDDEPLRIIAVLEGAPVILETCSAED